MLFEDRHEAGARLASELLALEAQGKLDPTQAVIVALPRGGVAVGYEIGRQLNIPLDVCIVRKVSDPAHPELALALAAVAENNACVINEDIVASQGLSDVHLQQWIQTQHLEVQRRIKKFRADTPPIELAGKTIILVDDGVATGATALAAIQALRTRQVRKIILALPVCAPDIRLRLEHRVDELVILQSPEFFQAVGQWYENFPQVTDEEVRSYLRRAQGFSRSAIRLKAPNIDKT
ncbi:MAG: putative phosphoribosyl transferase [Cyclobacteriaceae bacterium]|jgi:predicted phosphoribosyltransferase